MPSSASCLSSTACAKKDEGSYALDELKRYPAVNSYSEAPSREFYALKKHYQ